MVWDMKHRDWVFARMINYKDSEAKTAIRNRQKLLRKFIEAAPPTDCRDKLDYESIIKKYNDQVFGNQRSMDYLFEYCTNVLKLKHTKSPELRKEIKCELLQTNGMVRWCESALKIILYDIVPEHSVFILSKILRLNEKMNQILTQFKPKVVNKIKSMIKESIHLKCVTNDEQFTISVPFFPALETSVTHLVKYLRMNTPSTKSVHIPNDIDNGKLFEPSKINENGFQGIEHARGAMMLFWLRWHGELYQDLNEKSKNKPLLHSKKARNIMLQEISTVTLNNFLHNQDSGNLCGTGSLGVERINRYINSFHFNIGFKGLSLTYKQIKKIWFAANVKQFKLLLKNKEKWEQSIPTNKWEEIASFVQRYPKPTFVNKDCLLLKLNKNLTDKFATVANEWCLRDKLTFSKNPEWEWINDMKLLIWLCDHDDSWEFTRECEQELCQRFANLWDFEFLMSKVEEWGILFVEDESDD